MTSLPEAAAIIARLGLEPHPQGGWYREIFRDVAGPDGRARSTLIYYLLQRAEGSHWHRVDAVEVRHWYAGAPLRLAIAGADTPQQSILLGANVLAGQTPYGIVPALAWQFAETMGGWSLVGCQVTPGFEFSGFELAPSGWSPNS